MRWPSLLVVAMSVAWSLPLAAQGPTYKLGTPAVGRELHPKDAPVGPEGQGLPLGRGTAKEGAVVYIARGCAMCHGTEGRGGPGPFLVSANPGVGGNAFASAASGNLAAAQQEMHGTTDTYPFAPLIFSYINQTMPLDLMQMYGGAMRSYSNSEWPQKELGPAVCCLSANETYALTAYLLYLSGIIKEDDVMDAKSLPQVRMPRRDKYAPPPYVNGGFKPGLRQRVVN
jgi:S-disulfanyl-L-cysteine oxidoreductase SoxD